MGLFYTAPEPTRQLRKAFNCGILYGRYAANMCTCYLLTYLRKTTHGAATVPQRAFAKIRKMNSIRRYDTKRDAILTCAQKPTQVSLI